MDRRGEVKNKDQNTMRQDIHQDREREQAKAKSPHMERVVSHSGDISDKGQQPKQKLEKSRTIRREASIDRLHEYIVWERDGAESQSQRLWR